MEDYVISGEIDSSDIEYIDRDVKTLLRKNIGNTEPIHFHVKKYGERAKTKYSVHARVNTNFGFFTAKGLGLNLIEAFEECINHLERLIDEKKDEKVKP